MIVDFKVQNFRSIGFEQDVSLVASSDSLHPDHLIAPFGDSPSSAKLLRSILIYGGNASGKSNLCRAFFAMRQVVLRSATSLNEGDPLPEVTPFLFNSELASQGSMFEVRVILEGWTYRYGFVASSLEIEREWLYLDKNEPKTREGMVFERFGQDKSKWKFGPSFRKGSAHLVERTRASNCLLLSKAAQESYSVILPLFEWFHSGLAIVNMAASTQLSEARMNILADNETLNSDCITSLAKVADPGVRSTVADAPRDTGENATSSEQSATRQVKRLRLARVQNNSEDEVDIDFREESSGTQKFIGLAAAIVTALKFGQTLIIDELECSLHPLLTREIMSVINDAELGENNAQFIIATHDSNLFDFKINRRDQYYMAQKGSDHQTDVYRLDDLRPIPKSEAAAEKQYLDFRYGGVPALGNLRLAVANAIAHCDDAEAIHS
jgi:AAA15 family ATPase/GTPase